MFAFGQSGCNWAKVVVFGQKRLYSGKWLYSGISGCILAILLHLGKIGCIRTNWLCSGKVVVFGQK